MIVVDTNVVVYFYITSNRTQEAEQVMAKDSDWVAPFLWRSEFRNALVQYVRHQIITLRDAQQLVSAAEHLLRNNEFHVSSERILRLAASSTCSAYDCEFVALAQELRVPLVTGDEQILREFADVAVGLEQFVAA